VRSWKKEMRGIVSQYYFVKYVVLIFLLVLLGVVSIGVANGVFLSMSERTREIGTMMAIGARRSVVAALFLLEGVLINTASSAMGVLLGVAVTCFLDRVGFEAPSRGAVWLMGGTRLFPYLTPWSVLLSFLIVVGITMVGTSYPILKASKLEPTEALSYV
jgi:ABC-type lipoprotein release transport system permease subunit